MKTLICLNALLSSTVPLITVLTQPTVAGSIQINASNLEVGASSIPILGYIETRNWKIAIKVGNFYTVYSSTGKVLAEDITLEQMRIRFPNLHKVLQDGVIGQPLDASIN